MITGESSEAPEPSNEETEKLLPHANTLSDTTTENDAQGRTFTDPHWQLLPTIILIAIAVTVLLAGQQLAYRQRAKAAELFQSTGNVAPTVLISIDGFRHDYIERRWREGPRKGKYIATTMRMLAKTGASALLGMQPVFPTKTFPNHWTLATGLFPETSGITNNIMYDVKRKRYFHHSTNEPEWWHGEPIWKTLTRFKKNGGDKNATFTTATCFWPGSEVPGKQATTFLKYDDDMPYDQRINTVVSFFNGTYPKLNGVKADFTTLYMHGVDHAGHAHGPYSLQVDKEINRVDKALAHLLRMLGPSYATNYNIIIVSDHGMAEISNDRVVELTIPQGDALVVNISPFAEFIPKRDNATIKKLVDIVHSDVLRQGHGKAFRRSKLPRRWHLKNGEHVPPVLGLVDVGWAFKYSQEHPERPVRLLESIQHAEGKHHRHGLFHGHHPKNRAIRGNHGYDNNAHEMRSIFIAKGPGFQNSSSVLAVRAVDIYATICKLFGVAPSPNNGTTRATSRLLA